MNSAAGPLGEVAMIATTLYVADLDKAIEWYRDRLGLEPTTVGTDAFPFASYLLGGALVVLEPIEAALEAAGLGSGSTTVNVVVKRDPVAIYDALSSRGVECSRLAESPGYASFLMRDLDGNRFYVTKPRTPEAQASVESSAEVATGPSESNA
jgi:catechol 2,3-dioxygenase-like lactoylglutathione lyase family enzyme